MPWHPFLVHFPIAGWFFGCVLLWLALLGKRPSLREGGWCCLLLAGVFAIAAAVTGQEAYQSAVGVVDASKPLVTNSDLELHRDLGNVVPWLMGGLLLFKGHTVLAKQSMRVPEWLWLVPTTGIAALTFYVGHLGGRIVYLWGLVGRNGVL